MSLTAIVAAAGAAKSEMETSTIRAISFRLIPNMPRRIEAASVVVPDK